jgi:hypothetical protein
MHKMAVASLLLLLCSICARGQAASGDPSQPEQACLAKQPDLMAHSHMQEPKPIPTVKRLRFKEIPAETVLDSALLDEQPVKSLQEIEQPVTLPPSGSPAVTILDPAKESSTGDQH